MQTEFTLIRTDSDHRDFRVLVTALDEELKIRDGENFQFYAHLNKTAFLKYAVLLYESGSAAGCGSFRPYADGIMELKRMYVLPAKRGRGIASAILNALEDWCRELRMKKCILETGKNQPEAIALYEKHGYSSIPAYGKYQGSENSVCFEKKLI